MTREDIFGILYLISKGNPFRFRVRLQKLVIIAKQDKSFKFPFSFIFLSHYYGPYSRELNSAVGMLVANKFIDEICEIKEEGIDSTYSYSVTETGQRFLDNYIKKNGQILAETLDRLWSRFSGKSNEDIILYAKQISGLRSKHPRKNV